MVAPTIQADSGRTSRDTLQNLTTPTTNPPDNSVDFAGEAPDQLGEIISTLDPRNINLSPAGILG